MNRDELEDYAERLRDIKACRRSARNTLDQLGVTQDEISQQICWGSIKDVCSICPSQERIIRGVLMGSALRSSGWGLNKLHRSVLQQVEIARLGPDEVEYVRWQVVLMAVEKKQSDLRKAKTVFNSIYRAAEVYLPVILAAAVVTLIMGSM